MGARSGLGFIALLSALLTTLERRSMAHELLRGRRAGSQAMVGDDRQGRAKKRARRRLEKPPCPGKGDACPGSAGCINPRCPTLVGDDISFKHPGARKPDTPASVYPVIVHWLSSKGLSVANCPRLTKDGPHCLCSLGQAACVIQSRFSLDS